MANALRQYTQEVQNALEMLAHSPLASPLEVGEVGVEQERTFERRSSLTEMGVDFETRSEAVAKGFHYVSAGAVSAAVEAGGLAPVVPEGSVEASVIAKFHREGAVLLRVENATEYRIFDLGAVEGAVRRLVAKSSWDRDWILITHVIESSESLVLVSQQKEAEAEFRVGGAVGIGGIDLADANVSLTLGRRSGMAFEMVSGTRKTPLFHATRVVGGTLGPSRLRRLKKLLSPGSVSETEQALRFEPVTYH
jgi:hypothetical protein